MKTLARTAPAASSAPTALAPARLQRASQAALRLALGAWALVGLAVLTGHADAQPAAPLPEGTGPAVQALALQAARGAAGPDAQAASALRLQVQVGALDPRLKLAPCARVEPYLPPGARAWGATRVGLRCVDGVARWNVYLPVTVQVWTRLPVAAGALAAGTVLGAEHLAEAEVDLAALPAPPLPREALLGRTLGQAIAAGQPVRQAQIKPRQWFAAGDTVKVVALGAGYAVAAEGQALTAGLEGLPGRVRMDSGRVVVGQPVAERQMEVKL